MLVREFILFYFVVQSLSRSGIFEPWPRQVKEPTRPAYEVLCCIWNMNTYSKYNTVPQRCVGTGDQPPGYGAD